MTAIFPQYPGVQLRRFSIPLCPDGGSTGLSRIGDAVRQVFRERHCGSEVFASGYDRGMKWEQGYQQIGLIDESAECVQIVSDRSAFHAPIVTRCRRLL